MKYYDYCERYPYCVKEWLQIHIIENGCTYSEIAKVFGVSKMAVFHHGKRFGIRRKFGYLKD